jgi:hypothetical protein
MPKYTLATDSGTFLVSIKDDIVLDLMTREQRKNGIYIGVGGRNTCVFITAPFAGTTARLESVRTKDGGCALDKEIRGESTVQMVMLALTILKENAPHIRTVTLQDASTFECRFGNGERPAGISLALYELMFHQTTWYERHFGAYLSVPMLREAYESSKPNFLKKPTTFDFRNPDLNTFLTPILIDSEHWKDFFDKIYTMQNKCKIIFPWYQNALSSIFDTISYEGQEWCIDMDNTRIRTIPYTEIARQEGGRRRLRETRRKGWSSLPVFYDELQRIRYNTRDFAPLYRSV